MKVLVLTQHIFPIQTPRSIRSTELVKELARRGHDVTVYAVLGKYDYGSFENEYGLKVKNIPIRWEITPNSSDGPSKRNFIDKVCGRLFRRFEFPLFEFYYRIPEIIAKELQYDVLISISDPHHIHWGCARAKAKCPEKFPKRWIADSGDPFMMNGKTRDHLPRYEKYERLFSEACDYITVPIKDAIEAYYPEYREKIRVIPQGFDFDLNDIGETAVHNVIPTFAFAGMFYPDIRNPKQFLEYLCNVDRDFRFYVYTRFDNLLVDFKDRLNGKLIIKAPVPRNELINIMRGMDFLVNISNLNSPNQLPSKLIDYAIAGRPILDLNPQHIDCQRIDEFLNGDYSSALKINNLEQYHISRVVEKFEELFK